MEEPNSGANGKDQPPADLAGPDQLFTDRSCSCPEGMVGKLIGKRGETIKYMQTETGCSIQILHRSEGDPKDIVISGPSQRAVDQARTMIEQTLASEGPVGQETATMDCPPSVVGRIIGRGGETIRALQQGSQARVLVDQNYPEGVPRKIHISGRPDSVRRAQSMIEELISGEPGSAQAIIQKHAAGISKDIECPKSMVGRVIGKGGETIKALQRQSGANIQIDQSRTPCMVSVAGMPDAVRKAHMMIMDIINGGGFNPNSSSSLMQTSAGGRGGASTGFGGPSTAGFGAPGAFSPYSGGFVSGYTPAPGGATFAGGYGGFAPAGSFGTSYGQSPQGFSGFSGFSTDPYTHVSYGGSPGGFSGAAPVAFGGAVADRSSAAAAVGAAGTPAAAAVHAAGGGAGSGGAGGGTVRCSEWQELFDEATGRPYYWNTKNGMSQWDRPSGL